MLAVIVFPHGFTTALASEAYIVPRASHRRITPTACLGRVLGAEPQVRCRCLRLPQLVRQLRVAPPSPNQYVPFVAAYGSPLHLYTCLRVLGTASAHPTFLFSFLTGSASSLPPRQNWFHVCYHSLSLLSIPLKQSAQAITAVRWVILSLRHHAGVPLFR